MLDSLLFSSGGAQAASSVLRAGNVVPCNIEGAPYQSADKELVDATDEYRDV